jgi:hypothetical protein
MTTKKNKKKPKQKPKQEDLYELIVVDERETEPKKPEQPEQPEQLKQPKQPKQEITFKLGAEVGLFRSGTGLDKLGKILKITNQLLTVKWDDGTTEQFSRTGHSFYGNVNSVGEPQKPDRDDHKIWGTDEDPHLTIPTDDEKQVLAEKRKSQIE